MKAENQFIARVHKRLPPSVYREKTYNPLRSGTPDVYYEGPGDILWSEFKYLRTAAKRFTPRLTKLQANWLKRARSNGKQVAVIVGSPAGGMVLPGVTGIDQQVIADWKPIEEIAAWIQAAVN